MTFSNTVKVKRRIRRSLISRLTFPANEHVYQLPRISSSIDEELRSRAKDVAIKKRKKKREEEEEGTKIQRSISSWLLLLFETCLNLLAGATPFDSRTNFHSRTDFGQLSLRNADRSRRNVHSFLFARLRSSSSRYTLD